MCDMQVGNKPKITEEIIVYYQGDNFNEAIRGELKRLGLQEGQVMVIAIPISLKGKGHGVGNYGY